MLTKLHALVTAAATSSKVMNANTVIAGTSANLVASTTALTSQVGDNWKFNESSATPNRYLLVKYGGAGGTGASVI
jgi:hypothetical protein